MSGLNSAGANDDQTTGLPALMMEWAEATPMGRGVLQMRRGHWQLSTWADCAERVQHLALALDELNVHPRDVVAQVLVTSQDAWFLDLATQALGARSAAIDPDSPRADIKAALRRLAPTVIAVDGPDLAHDVLGLVEEGLFPRPQIITRQGADMFDGAFSFIELAELGRIQAESQPYRYAELAEKRSRTEVVAVTVDYDSTNGPLLLDVTSDALLSAGRAIVDQFSLTPADLVVSVTPLAHPVERGTTYAGSLSAGAPIGFPETPSSVLAAVADLQPTFLHGPPTFWRTTATQMRSRLAYNTGVKRFVRDLWERVSLLPLMEERPVSMAGRFFRFLVGAAALRKLGMDQIHSAITTGPVVSTGHMQVLAAFGLEVRRGYGCPHSMGLVALSNLANGDLELPAGLMAGVQMRLGNDGDVGVSGVVVSGEGLTPTGDWARSVTEGQIRVGGSGRGLIKGSFPAEIESQLCSSMYIKHVVVYEEGDSTCALVQVDATAAGDWARSRGLEFTTFESLCALEPVRDLIEVELDRLEPGRLTEYRLLSEPLRRHLGELTINQEVNREVILTLRGAAAVGGTPLS